MRIAPLLALPVLFLAGCTSLAPQDSQSSSSASSVAASSAQSSVNVDITVSGPAANSQVSSPLTVTGEARGGWYFEASFPVKLLDANGNVLAQAPAQAQGDWMTVNFVPFTATLSFATPATTTGSLVLSKDNPSGEPANDASIVIPVQF